MKTGMVDIALCTMAAVLPGCASSGVGLSKTTVAATPVPQHGLLKAAGNKIVDKTDTPVRLVGMSLFWPVWGGERFFTKEVVDWLVTDWKCTLFRAWV